MDTGARKILGIDYGTKRIGLAISDELGIFAFPRQILDNKEDALDKIGEMIQNEHVTEIVIGESNDFKGKPNAVAAEIGEFAKKMEIFALPVRFEKEFLTSVEARRLQQTPGRVDASAAALILQRYLDRKNNKK